MCVAVRGEPLHVGAVHTVIAQADKVDMLAGVMAHEISHIVHRDVLKQVEQQQEISAIGSILLGQNPSALSQIVAQGRGRRRDGPIQPRR